MHRLSVGALAQPLTRYSFDLLKARCRRRQLRPLCRRSKSFSLASLALGGLPPLTSPDRVGKFLLQLPKLKGCLWDILEEQLGPGRTLKAAYGERRRR